MADNGPMKDGLSQQEGPASSHDSMMQQRREFIRKATLIGVPAILATVRPRTAWATVTQTGSTKACIQSVHASGCNPNGLGFGRDGQKLPGTP